MSIVFAVGLIEYDNISRKEQDFTTCPGVKSRRGALEPVLFIISVCDLMRLSVSAVHIRTAQEGTHCPLSSSKKLNLFV